jgi:hypothetical protein
MRTLENRRSPSLGETRGVAQQSPYGNMMLKTEVTGAPETGPASAVEVLWRGTRA